MCRGTAAPSVKHSAVLLQRVYIETTVEGSVIYRITSVKEEHCDWEVRSVWTPVW